MKRRIETIIVHMVLLLIAFCMLAPLLWMAANALSPNTFYSSVLFVPRDPSFDNFTTAWYYPETFRKGVTMGRFFLNSLLVMICTVAAGLIIDSMAGYVLALKNFPGRDLFYLATLSTLMIPFFVILLPDYLIITKLGWVNKYRALIVPFLSSGMGVCMFRSWFRMMGTEMEESAKIDGAGDGTVYFRIMLPNAKPAIVMIAVLRAMWSWDEFMWPTVVTNNIEMYTIQQGLMLFRGLNVTQWGYLCAGMTIALLPLIVLFIILQKFVFEGIQFNRIRA